MNIKIETGIPMPENRRKPESHLGLLREAIGRLNDGESFLWPGSNKDPYRAALDIGRKIVTRKENGSGYRVWLRQSFRKGKPYSEWHINRIDPKKGKGL